LVAVIVGLLSKEEVMYQACYTEWHTVFAGYSNFRDIDEESLRCGFLMANTNGIEMGKPTTNLGT
jgi:hypothetical protein